MSLFYQTTIAYGALPIEHEERTDAVVSGGLDNVAAREDILERDDISTPHAV